MDKKKILLIEDEAFIRDLYNHVLTQQGYEVLLAEDGEAGINLAQKHPDLILLDIMLPKLNGIEVLKVLIADPELRKIPVVVLTNLGQDAIIKQAFDLGATGYLIKSKSTPEEVVASINEYLNKSNIKPPIMTA